MANEPYYEFTDDAGTTHRRYADVWKTRTVNLPAVVTEQPVENGAKITDHYRPEPNVLKGELYWSNTPIRKDLQGGEILPLEISLPDPPKRALYTPGGLNQAVQDGLSKLLGATPGKPNLLHTLQFPTEFDVREIIYNEIELVRQNGYLLTIFTGWALFADLAIENASIQEDVETNGDCAQSHDLKKNKIVTSQVTLAIPLAPRAQATKTGGAKGGDEVTDPSKQKSVAAALADSLGFGVTR
jgi:hypothetical protein